MPREDDRLLHETTSLCRVCKNGTPARIVARADGEVWMRKACPDHGPQDVRIGTDADWYERTRAIGTRAVRPPVVRREIERGCPFDCGPCESHEQKVRLPVVTITSACNLDCPICYVHNKNDGAFHMELDEYRAILDRLVADAGGDLDLVNLTGGEPTVHPRLLELLEVSREAGVHRVSVCTNGLRLASDERLVERLAELGARVALSFDTFEGHADVALQGVDLLERKLLCLDLLEKYDVDTTLIPVMTRGVNDAEIGRIIRFGLEKPNVRHVEVHTMTYTGQGGASFDRSGRISMNETLEEIVAQCDGLLRREDFVPSPCAHPLCYQIAYLMVDPVGGPPIPFGQLLDRETIYDCLGDHLYLEPSSRLEQALQEAIDRLWVEDDDESKRRLRILDRLLREVLRGGGTRDDALRRSERAAKAVYVHSHMDEETFDTERASQCCASNCYPDGTTIPVCNYNVLYREKEPRFMASPVPWNERSGGQVSFAGAGCSGSGSGSGGRQGIEV